MFFLMSQSNNLYGELCICLMEWDPKQFLNTEIIHFLLQEIATEFFTSNGRD